MENEILREALAKARTEASLVRHWSEDNGERHGICAPTEGRFAMSRVAEVLGVSRSQLHARASGQSKSRGRHSKPEDAELLPALRRLVDARPTYGYRRIAALLNRERRKAGLAKVNRKRVLRILGRHGLTLERCTGRREGRTHDGTVAVMASNLRWCSDGLEIVCRTGGKGRIARDHCS
jgi:putative transposase